MITLQEIAVEAGVSKGSVSAVLNGKAKERRIASETCRRIEAIARRRGYEHNVQARYLRSGVSNLVGIMCHTQPQHHHIQARAAARILIDAGYRVSIQDLAWHPEREANGIKEFLGLRAEGILLQSGASAEEDEAYQLLKRMAREKFPMVRLDFAKGLPVDVVTIDREHGAYVATCHLFESGHRRVAYAIDKDLESPFIQDRLRGYRRAHHDWGIRLRDELFVDLGIKHNGHQEEYDAGLCCMSRVLALRSRPTALLATSDFVAMGAISAALEAGIQVPGDLAVMGFGGYPEAKLTSIPLSTIEFPFEAMAEEAVRLLLERIGGHKGAPRQVVIKPVLNLGRSTAAAKDDLHATKQPVLVAA